MKRKFLTVPEENATPWRATGENMQVGLRQRGSGLRPYCGFLGKKEERKEEG